jgi:hypothetical protein
MTCKKLKTFWKICHTFSKSVLWKDFCESRSLRGTFGQDFLDDTLRFKWQNICIQWQTQNYVSLQIKIDHWTRITIFFTFSMRLSSLAAFAYITQPMTTVTNSKQRQTSKADWGIWVYHSMLADWTQLLPVYFQISSNFTVAHSILGRKLKFGTFIITM